MPFFLKKKNRGAINGKPLVPNKKKKPSLKDIEISSDSDDDELLFNQQQEKAAQGGGGHGSEEDGSESDGETAQDKRYRLAQKYLDEVKQKEAEEKDDKDIDVAARLRTDILGKTGKLHRKLASTLDHSSLNSAVPLFTLKGHKLSPTVLAISNDGLTAVSASKDGSIIKWDLTNGHKLARINGLSPKAEGPATSGGHQGSVLALAISSDDKFLCSGGEDAKIQVWDYASMKPIKSLTDKFQERKRHKKAITGLCIRRGHYDLYACSRDRTVTVWDLNQLMYIDYMQGHEDGLESIDCLGRERLITCGGMDKSIRIFKVQEESQLIYHAHKEVNTIECVRLINEEKFVSGADDGSLSVWSVLKKKPLHVRRNAHSEEKSWISAVAALKYTDLIASASGSWDGGIKLWETSEDFKSLQHLTTIPVKGFINDLCFTPKGDGLLCAVGQEHKNGRWWKVKEAKNSIVYFKLPTKDSSEE